MRSKRGSHSALQLCQLTLQCNSPQSEKQSPLSLGSPNLPCMASSGESQEYDSSEGVSKSTFLIDVTQASCCARLDATLREVCAQDIEAVCGYERDSLDSVEGFDARVIQCLQVCPMMPYFP